MKRKDVYKVLDTERDYQERQKKNALSHVVEDFPLGSAFSAMRVLIAEAETEWYKEQAPYPKSMDKVRKIGGIITQMGEEYGMPERRDMKQEASDFVDRAEEKIEEVADKIEEAAERFTGKAKEFSELLKKEGLSNETKEWLKKNVTKTKDD